MRRGNVSTFGMSATLLVGLVILLTQACGARHVPSPPAAITMEALHQAGGVPPHWRFTVPPGNATAGRQAFDDFGCPSCHTVQGEVFAPKPDAPNNAGPDLTGMGDHHPAEYFAESILNPDAVLVLGPGYIGPDGRSVMPTYANMTLKQLADIVAYLQSLKSPAGSSHVHVHEARSFVVYRQELTAERFDAFEEWFADAGARELTAAPGFVSVDTYVTRTPAGRLVIAVFGFEDDAVLHDFVERAQSAGALDGFFKGDGASVYRSPAVYRALGLSLP